MKRLIVNADDFGRHEAINEAVLRGFMQGCITSASIMPNCHAFEGAVEIAQRYDALGVGVHFTLVGEKPILSAENIPTLVQENGFFADDYMNFVKRYFMGKICRKEIRAELSAQLMKVKQAGINITHVDSHQHLHVLPGIIDIVLDLAKEQGIHFVRIPRIPVAYTGGYHVNLGQVIGRMGLSLFAALAKNKAQAKNFKSPDYFMGIVAGGNFSEHCMMETIDRLQDGVTEIMLHPGQDDALLARECKWNHGFEAELNASLSNDVLHKLENKNVELINFSKI